METSGVTGNAFCFVEETSVYAQTGIQEEFNMVDLSENKTA